MKKTFYLPLLAGLLVGSIATAPHVSADSLELGLKKLEQSHIEFVFKHHMETSVDPETSRHEIVSNSEGAPVSLFFDLDGVSAYFQTKDGSIVHTLFKAHRAIFGLPEGVELAFSLSVGSAEVLDLHRTYGIMELGTISADIQAAVKNVQSKEWRETTVTLGKMLLCAQLEKLRIPRGIPPLLVNWITKALKPSCAE